MTQSNQSNQAGSLSQGYQGLACAAIPREKGPLSNAQEALGYLSELESLNAEIRRKLYGPFPQEDQSNSAIIPREQSLEEMLRWICQRTALAVGDAKNLLSKLD